MKRSTVCMNNKNQAVGLTMTATLPASVTKVDMDNTRLNTSAGESWDEWFDGPGVSDDFMSEREQPA
ncbi:MAG: AbrB/MazE/SpoVT family DNA-binding domain-containing protein [Gammaproteobacteria bacterium]|nr:AbrB/MazE/SpoVT family DNA-binding domain-containing protein [Gammaproteobacteria bacterium]